MTKHEKEFGYATTPEERAEFLRCWKQVTPHLRGIRTGMVAELAAELLACIFADLDPEIAAEGIQQTHAGLITRSAMLRDMKQKRGLK